MNYVPAIAMIYWGFRCTKSLFLSGAVLTLRWIIRIIDERCSRSIG
jgi:hypothetical protein